MIGEGTALAMKPMSGRAASRALRGATTAAAREKRGSTRVRSEFGASSSRPHDWAAPGCEIRKLARKAMLGNAPRADNKYPLLFQRRKACAHKLAGRRGHVFAARMIGDARQVIARAAGAASATSRTTPSIAAGTRADSVRTIASLDCAPFEPG